MRTATTTTTTTTTAARSIEEVKAEYLERTYAYNLARRRARHAAEAEAAHFESLSADERVAELAEKKVIFAKVNGEWGITGPELVAGEVVTVERRDGSREKVVVQAKIGERAGKAVHAFRKATAEDLAPKATATAPAEEAVEAETVADAPAKEEGVRTATRDLWGYRTAKPGLMTFDEGDGLYEGYELVQGAIVVLGSTTTWVPASPGGEEFGRTVETIAFREPTFEELAPVREAEAAKAARDAEKAARKEALTELTEMPSDLLDGFPTIAHEVEREEASLGGDGGLGAVIWPALELVTYELGGRWALHHGSEAVAAARRAKLVRQSKVFIGADGSVAGE